MRTILIVDDEELFRRSLADGLEASDPHWTALTAEGAARAREILETTQVDLVVTDLQMPAGSGFELLDYLVQARPWVPVLVVTAHGGAATAARLSRMGVGRLLEKPLDFEVLVRSVAEVFASSAGGLMRGISLSTFLQLLEMERRSCTLRVSAKGRVGWLHIVDGQLDAAECGELIDESAAYEVVCWDDALLEILATPPVASGRMSLSIRQVLLDSFRRRDELAAAADQATAKVSDNSTSAPAGRTGVVTSRKEKQMSVQDKLKELAAVEGFAGAGVFTPQGESLAMVSAGTGFTKEIGVLANNVLMNAQKASIEMGAGRGQQVHVTAEKAHILVRCLNEGNDPLKSEPGKAHIHLVMALSDDSAIGMAKMKLGAVIEKLGPDFRL